MRPVSGPKRRLRRLVPISVAGAIAFAALPVAAADPVVVAPVKQTPKERRAARKTKDMSEGGTRRGILELALGSVALAGSAALIGRGVWEIVEGRKLEDECNRFISNNSECGAPNPSRDSEIGAGLSFGFAVPLAVAAGFLLARGLRIERDYKEFRRKNPEVAVFPQAGSTGGGIVLRLRF